MYSHDDVLLGLKKGSLLNKLKPTSEQVLADLKGFLPDKALHQLGNKYERDTQDQDRPLIGCLPPNQDVGASRPSRTLQRPNSAAPPREHRKHDSVDSELCFSSDSDEGSDDDEGDYLQEEIGHFDQKRIKPRKVSGLKIGRFLPHPPSDPIPLIGLSNYAKLRRGRITEHMPFGVAHTRRQLLPDVKPRPHQLGRGELPPLPNINTICMDLAPLIQPYKHDHL